MASSTISHRLGVPAISTERIRANSALLDSPSSDLWSGFDVWAGFRTQLVIERPETRRFQEYRQIKRSLEASAPSKHPFMRVIPRPVRLGWRIGSLSGW